MAQIKTRTVRASTLMGNQTFAIGFNEVLKGLPCDPDRFCHMQGDKRHNGPWAYERGRQFACIWRGTLKHGHKVNPEALKAYMQARRERVII